MIPPRAHRAGDSLEDFCRVCKTDRLHTIIVVDADGRADRVACGYCGSEHNYRGGPRVNAVRTNPSNPNLTNLTNPSNPSNPRFRDALALVSDRERSLPPVMLPADPPVDLELLLRRVIREETGITPVAPADKWRDGLLVLRPGKAGLQEKTWPIETFFHKVVMLRNRLRTLEQQLNASELPDDVKVRLQSYITGCYGSLTSFNVLFADPDGDGFSGTGE